MSVSIALQVPLERDCKVIYVPKVAKQKAKENS